MANVSPYYTSYFIITHVSFSTTAITPLKHPSNANISEIYHE